jgi:hypothetical protein
MVHAAFEQFGERLAGGAAIVLAPSTPSACMAFIIAKATGKLLIVQSAASGVLHHADLINSAEYPLLRLTQDLVRHRRAERA